MNEKENKIDTKKVGKIGLFANLFLLVMKFLGGIFFKSQALIADAVNSFGDIFSSTVTVIGAKIASKPEDEEHEFGHGKAEYVASFLIGIFMITASIVTLYNSLMSALKNQSFKPTTLLVCIPIITIAVKGILYAYTKYVANKKKDLLIFANVVDHRNDMFLSFGVLVGIIFGYYGYYFVDGMLGAIISIMIIITGTKILMEAYDILIDKCIDANISTELMKQIMEMDGVNHIDEVKSKPTGDKHMLIIKISVDPNMTVLDSHKIAGKIRAKMKQNENIYDAIVHVNPDI